jgi:hypothetical protein
MKDTSPLSSDQIKEKLKNPLEIKGKKGETRPEKRRKLCTFSRCEPLYEVGT